MQRVRKIVECDDIYEIKGEGVTIAVLDSGISAHPDLRGRVLSFRDFVNHRSVMYDDNGHGTHVCGILCGSGAASDGKYRGIAPGANIIVGKVLNEKGDGAVEDMIDALDWIMKYRDIYHIRILNISIGIGDLSEISKTNILTQKIEMLWDCGIMVICAAGNKGPAEGSISAVCRSDRIVTVGCHDGDTCLDNVKRCETYSGRGYAGVLPKKPDIVAPGTDIFSCNANSYKGSIKLRNAYVKKSGTSMATPIVAGAMALLMQKNPTLKVDEYKQRMQYTARDMNLPWNVQGWGMLNVKSLLK